MGAETKLEEHLIDLPEPPLKPAEFSHVVLNGKKLYLSGILPFAEGGRLFAGRAGATARIDVAKQAARAAILQALSIIKKEIGSLDKIRRLYKLEVFIASGPDFKEHRDVADSASNLINQIFGALGKHTQLVIGVPSLPRNALLTISLEAEIK